MELRSKVIYHCSYGTLEVGDTTAGVAFSEEEKQKLLDTFPDWFEVIQPTKAVETFSTPEDSLVIETPEAKAPKSRKK